MRRGRTRTAGEVVAVLVDLVAARGAAEHLHRRRGRRPSGRPGRRPRRTGAPAHGQRTRDDRLDVARLRPHGGTRTTFIEPGSPWENPFVESFNSRLRDECLDQHWFALLEEARQVIEA